ncbi:hypothetical protein LP419_00550 [Massilia sp. H-1]|nr:hypothetical protein LP419_00550 [Massilia sp. H-1]
MPQPPFNFSFFLFGHYAYAGTFATYAALFFAARHERAPDRRAAVADPGDAHRRPQCVGLGGRPYQPPRACCA